MKKILTITSCLLLLSGCSLFSDEQKVDPEFEYVSVQEQPPIALPAGASSPEYSEDFRVPALGGKADRSLVGERLEVASPKLILPLVTGSRVVEGSTEAEVQFDQVDDSQPLDTAIWNSLINYLDERGIGVVDYNQETQTLKTDWMIIEGEDDSPWYSWTKTERSIGQRFEFELEMKAHGRSATLRARLVDYLETVNDDVIGDISNDKERRNEIEVLNSVIGHYEKQLRIADARLLRRIQTGVSTELGFNADGDPAFLVSADYDIAWPRVLLVLRKLGFNVKDLDKSTGILFINYLGSGDAWWSGLFSSNDELPIEKTDYRLTVKKQGEITSLTWSDADNNVLSAQVVSDLHGPFSEVMSEDNLDIN